MFVQIFVSSHKMSVEAVKEKLWKKCGTSVNSMSLQLYDDTGAKIADISDNMRPFGFYSPLDGLVLSLIFFIDLDLIKISNYQHKYDCHYTVGYNVKELVMKWNLVRGVICSDPFSI